jgi:hypothetical protein
MNLDKLLSTLTEDQKKELLSALALENEEGLVENKDPAADPPSISEDFTVTTKNKDTDKKRRTKVKGGKNKWEDTGELSHIETPDFEKTERRRSPSKKMSVDCHVCGKTFKVNPSLVYGEFHRCNRCTGK